MNPITFSEILTDIPDSFIESAAEPHSKPIRWYRISAAAACIVLLIAAALYPKLRMQTPEIAVPPESVAEVITSTTTAPEIAEYTETQTATSPLQTTFDSVTATVSTTASVAASATVTETKTPTPTEPPETDVPVVTELPAESTDPIVTVATKPQPITVPVWQGITVYPESVSLPHIDCRFGLCPNDANDRLRTEYGISPEYDLTQHQCLLIDVESGYSMAAVIGGKLAPEGMSLKVIYLNQPSDLAVQHYVIPLPENYTLDTENCYAECTELTDETEFQAMLTESPMIELIE